MKAIPEGKGPVTQKEPKIVDMKAIFKKLQEMSLGFKELKQDFNSRFDALN